MRNEIDQPSRLTFWNQNGEIEGIGPLSTNGPESSAKVRSVDLNYSCRETNISGVFCSCNRKDRNDGNERNAGVVTCGGTRSTSSPEISSAGACSTDGARGNGLRGTEALLRSDASEHRVPAPQACGA